MRPLSEWSVAERLGIKGVFTDIDDTLTTRGAITPDALRALADLKAAGLTVIPITGRPIGWCAPFAQGDAERGIAPWPVNAFVAENGGAAFVPQGVSPHTLSHKIYPQDAATRADNHQRMQVIAARVLVQVPGVQLSRDSVGRETDLAFDHSEFDDLSDSQIAQVIAILQDAGMQTTVSSIHIHGCFGHFSKWEGARWIVQSLFGRDLSLELNQWMFVGDSGNDQAMFEHFTRSVGVANICHVADRLTFLPRFVTPSERGAGFAEVARAILDARQSSQA
jgi:HAD superfamily hydrolase (TIGR01484 family)